MPRVTMSGARRVTMSGAVRIVQGEEPGPVEPELGTGDPDPYAFDIYGVGPDLYRFTFE